MLVKLFLLIWFTLAGLAVLKFFFSSPFSAWKWTIIGVGCLVLLYALVWIPWQRKRREFHVYRRGGAEGGVLFYRENARTLQFYFDRRLNTIYIPSDRMWGEVTPTWAQNRKQEIVDRIKMCVGRRVIGKSWRYEESDDRSRIIPHEPNHSSQ